MIKLSELKSGESGRIVKIFGDNKLCKRIMQLGFTVGQTVKVLSISSLKKSYLLSVRSYAIALRKDRIDLIGVEKL